MNELAISANVLPDKAVTDHLENHRQTMKKPALDQDMQQGMQQAMQQNTKEDTHLHRFELNQGGQLCGFIDYYLFGAVVIVTHTEVNPALEGKGYGSQLARQALDYFRSQGKQVVPVCGFMASFIRKHGEYADLITPDCRRIFKV